MSIEPEGFGDWMDRNGGGVPDALRAEMQSKSEVAKAKAARESLRLAGLLGIDEAPSIRVRKRLFGQQWKSKATALAEDAMQAIDEVLAGDVASAIAIARRTVTDAANASDERNAEGEFSTERAAELLADRPDDWKEDDPDED